FPLFHNIMNTVYLDNSATTPLCEAAKQAIREAMECYGNPSSLHPEGARAHAVLEQARRDFAATLGLRGTLAPGQVIFTASGTESDQLALCGTAYAKPRRRGGRIITTDSEHAAVRKTLDALEKEGFEVVRVPTRGGVLDLDFYEKALNDRVFLVSMMTVNNETGALYDIGTAFSMAKAKNPDIVTHTDAVQGYLKCRLIPKALSADLITVSGHKIHAPKGVGALAVSADALRRRDLIPVLLGGGQESGFRSGTENVLGISAFAAAAKEGFAELGARIERMRMLREEAEKMLSALPVRINRPAGERAPHILNVTLPDIRSETMLHELSKSGICISSGSACSSHVQTPSAALTAFGLTREEIESSIRISFSHLNTLEEVALLAASMGKAIERLVKIHH
ncbi:MAG: cysteine desulfurase, partial [Clostridia bacterium]|nr:cysteine desulfurase [Clostridia bacterium]